MESVAASVIWLPTWAWSTCAPAHVQRHLVDLARTREPPREDAGALDDPAVSSVGGHGDLRFDQLAAGQDRQGLDPDHRRHRLDAR